MIQAVQSLIFSAEDQDALLNYLVVNQKFTNLNANLINWQKQRIINGQFSFSLCLSLKENRIHHCHDCIAKRLVLKNYWCCQLFMSSIFIDNKWTIQNQKDSHPFLFYPTQTSKKQLPSIQLEPMNVATTTAFNPRGKYKPMSAERLSNETVPVKNQLKKICIKVKTCLGVIKVFCNHLQ